MSEKAIEYESIDNISGWILPNGRWIACDDWWHIPAIYDLQEEGLPELKTAKAKKALKEGKEEQIRDLMSELGYVKIGRRIIDGQTMTQEQLQTLIELTELCGSEDEFEILNSKIKETRELPKISIRKIEKLKNPSIFF